MKLQVSNNLYKAYDEFQFLYWIFFSRMPSKMKTAYSSNEIPIQNPDRPIILFHNQAKRLFHIFRFSFVSAHFAATDLREQEKEFLFHQKRNV